MKNTYKAHQYSVSCRGLWEGTGTCIGGLGAAGCGRTSVGSREVVWRQHGGSVEAAWRQCGGSIEAEHRRGLSRVAVKGSGSNGGGMYRAVATRHCGWGHGSWGPGLGTHGWQKRRHCGWGMCPCRRVSLLWSAMGHPL